MPYEFKAKCPACGSGEPSNWYMGSCGHLVYIWTDLDVGCKECMKYKNILEWYYDCGDKKCKGQITNVIVFLNAMAALADASNIPNETWREMNKHLGELAMTKLCPH